MTMLPMNHDSILNQSIKEKFVNREVLVCQSGLVSSLLEENVFSYDDVSDMEYYYADLSDSSFEGSYGEKQELMDELSDAVSELDDKLCELSGAAFNSVEAKRDRLQSDYDLLDETESSYREVLEWWVVTAWMLGKLKSAGECVLENDYGDWWGRCCSGQAILLDGTISSICEDMGILQGQKHEWKV